MPQRMHKVRVSVRKPVQSEDSEFHHTTTSYQHQRYQILKSLTPVSAERVFEMGRAGYEADWEGVTWRKPKIKDGWRLVTFIDGSPDLTLVVNKRVERGKEQHLFLYEDPTIQS